MITRNNFLLSATVVTVLGILGTVTMVIAPRRTIAGLQKSATIEGSNEFTFRLLARLATKSPAADNLFLSPFSIQQAALLTANGAAGTTQKEILRSLQLPIEIGPVNQDEKSIDHLLAASPYEVGMGYIRPAYQWQRANAIWTRNKPGEAFQKNCQYFYGAEARPFTSVKAINDWSNQKTQGCLPHVLDDVPAQTKVLLTNAVYFKGRWMHEFDGINTQTDTLFYASGDTKGSTLPRMNQEGWDIPFYRGDGYEAVSLPYRGGIRMVVILPDKKIIASDTSKRQRSIFGSKYSPFCFVEKRPSSYLPQINGVPEELPEVIKTSTDSPTANELAAQLTSAQWNQLKAGLKPNRVWVSLPRFQLEYSTSLLDDLIAMGMPVEGDFQPMAKEVDHIDLLVHQTFLRVDEKGTEAAAVTVQGAGSCSASLSCPHPFIVDHPFLCVIEHEATGTILFIGVINNPKVAR